MRCVCQERGRGCRFGGVREWRRRAIQSQPCKLSMPPLAGARSLVLFAAASALHTPPRLLPAIRTATASRASVTCGAVGLDGGGGGSSGGGDGGGVGRGWGSEDGASGGDDDALPPALLAALAAGRIGAVEIANWKALLRHPLSRALASVGYLRDRLLAEPRLVTMLGIELALGCGCTLAADLAARGDAFLREADFVLTNQILIALTNTALVLMLSPAAAVAAPPAAGTRGGALAALPGYFLQKGRFSSRQRLACFALRGVQFSAVGAAASSLGQGLTYGLVALRGLAAPPPPPPPPPPRRRRKGARREEQAAAPVQLAPLLPTASHAAFPRGTARAPTGPLAHRRSTTLSSWRPRPTAATSSSTRSRGDASGCCRPAAASRSPHACASSTTTSAPPRGSGGRGSAGYSSLLAEASAPASSRSFFYGTIARRLRPWRTCSRASRSPL